MRCSRKLQVPVLLNLGNFQSKSAYFAKFVTSSNPAYSYIKPWWLSTFSATLLGGKRLETSGRLLPGFCPHFPQYTEERFYKIQEHLKQLVSNETLITFVRDKTEKTPPTLPQSSTGIYNYS